jgi:hypothetical protein
VVRFRVDFKIEDRAFILQMFELYFYTIGGTPRRKDEFVKFFKKQVINYGTDMDSQFPTPTEISHESKYLFKKWFGH